MSAKEGEIGTELGAMADFCRTAVSYFIVLDYFIDFILLACGPKPYRSERSFRFETAFFSCFLHVDEKSPEH